jgi:hypothetical protein
MGEYEKEYEELAEEIERLEREKEEEQQELDHFNSVAKRLNKKLSRPEESDAPDLRHFVTDLLAEANREIGGEGIFTIFPEEEEKGVYIRYVDRGGESRQTILYDGNNKKFLVNSADDLRERQRQEYASQKIENSKPSSGGSQEKSGGNTMIYSFEQVWRVIDGDHKTSTMEVLEALQEKISEQEHMASKLFHTRKFETFTSVEQEKNSFVQVMYGFQKLPFLNNGDENESEIWKAAREKREERDRGKSVDSKDIEVGQRVTFKPNDGKMTLTGTVREINEHAVILQCGRTTIPVLREKGSFAEAPEPDLTHTKDYAKEQAQKHAGKKSNVFTAKGKDAIYHGTIVEITPAYAIQKVGEDAIIHRLKDLGKDQSLISAGQNVSITKGGKGEILVETNKERAQEQSRESNGQAR